MTTRFATLVKADPGIDVAGLIQALMVEDIRAAADVLRPVYDRTRGRDGYVSIEVTPSKARDTEGTIAEVQELWSRVGRPNVMIKIPATREGLPAIARAIRDGININVTLIFSEVRYREVADVYQTGLEQRLRDGNPLGHVASVASVFVSRIDTLVDAQLETLIARQRDPVEATRLGGLRGRAAVANTQMIYQAFKEIFASPRFAALGAAGAVPQRPLWGSTGTKNPAYHDLLYVDSLIGRHTVNTVPPQTYAAIIDHGRPEPTIERNLDEARRHLDLLPGAGIDLTRVLQTLEDEGVAAFEQSFDGLYANLARKKERVEAAANETDHEATGSRDRCGRQRHQRGRGGRGFGPAGLRAIQTGHARSGDAESDGACRRTNREAFRMVRTGGMRHAGPDQRGKSDGACQPGQILDRREGPALYSSECKCPVTVPVLNDADAAGLAEMRFGAGKGRTGVVLMLTLGTGIGSAVFVDGRLMPNTELGQIELNGKIAEQRASARARKEKGLTWEKWGKRLNEYLHAVEELVWPDLIILGGGVSKKADKFFPFIKTRAELVAAVMYNQAGIIWSRAGGRCSSPCIIRNRNLESVLTGLDRKQPGE